tara:strand:+ start:803 stop:2035 length:1233 start_codon:yes stop_codon:yes gene_type:complete
MEVNRNMIKSIKTYPGFPDIKKSNYTISLFFGTKFNYDVSKPLELNIQRWKREQTRLSAKKYLHLMKPNTNIQYKFDNNIFKKTIYSIKQHLTFQKCLVKLFNNNNLGGETQYLIRVKISSYLDVPMNINVSHKERGTLAFYFSSEGREDLLDHIVKCGANIHTKHPENSKDPLIISAEKGHTNILQLLYENNADFTSKDYLNDNLINWCVYKNNLNYLIYAYRLINEKYKHRPKIIREIFNNRGYLGMNPLFVSVNRCCTKITDYLSNLNCVDLDINIRTRKGYYLMFYVIKTSNIKMACRLFELYPNIVNKSPSATYKGNCLTFILDNGKIMGIKQSEISTFVDLFISYNVDLTIKNKKGLTALAICFTDEKHIDIGFKLLENGAYINDKLNKHTTVCQHIRNNFVNE